MSVSEASLSAAAIFAGVTNQESASTNLDRAIAELPQDDGALEGHQILELQAATSQLASVEGWLASDRD
jgi:hypothetical protein